MSIQNIVQFQSGIDKLRELNDHADAVQAKRFELQKAKEEWNIDKQAKETALKLAQSKGQITQFNADMALNALKESSSNESKMIDLASKKQDLTEQNIFDTGKQIAQQVKTLHDNDPDVQSHAQTLTSIMQANNAPQMSMPNKPEMSMINQGYPIGAKVPQQAQQSMTPQGSAIPSIIPQQTAQMPQQEVVQKPAVEQGSVDNQITQEPSQQVATPWDRVQQRIKQTYGEQFRMNPNTLEVEEDPIVKAKLQAKERAQETYDINQPFREQVRQDRLEKQATDYLTKTLSNKSSPLSIQDNKVNAAIHARDLLNQVYDPVTGNFNLSKVPYGELSESIGTLVSGGSASSEGRINALKEDTLKGRLNGVITFFTGKPSNASSQDAIKQLAHIIDRQGERSEELREEYFSDIKKLPVFKQLDEDRAFMLQNSHMGSSYKEFMKNSPDQQKQSSIPEGRVEVIDSTGRRGHIPASQLQEALSSGYKEVK